MILSIKYKNICDFQHNHIDKITSLFTGNIPVSLESDHLGLLFIFLFTFYKLQFCISLSF